MPEDKRKLMIEQSLQTGRKPIFLVGKDVSTDKRIFEIVSRKLGETKLHIQASQLGLARYDYLDLIFLKTRRSGTNWVSAKQILYQQWKRLKGITKN